MITDIDFQSRKKITDKGVLESIWRAWWLEWRELNPAARLLDPREITPDIVNGFLQAIWVHTESDTLHNNLVWNIERLVMPAVKSWCDEAEDF